MTDSDPARRSGRHAAGPRRFSGKDARRGAVLGLVGSVYFFASKLASRVLFHRDLLPLSSWHGVVPDLISFVLASAGLALVGALAAGMLSRRLARAARLSPHPPVTRTGE
jgi:hypothetical protein